MPEFTVIIPCYNYGHLLAETLDSVLCQTDPDWECIVVDDGSTDNTKDVAMAYVERDGRFKYIYQANNGLSSARNTGLKSAKGEFLQFLDADDLIERRKLELQALFLREHPEVDIVFGEMRYFSTDSPEELFYSIDGKNSPLTKKISGMGKDILLHLVVDNIMVVNSPIIRKTVVESAGCFDESLKALEDWEFWLRCALENAVFSYHDSPDSLALVRFHHNSMSRNKQLMLSTNIEIRRRLKCRIKDHSLLLLNDRGIFNSENAMAINAVRDGKIFTGMMMLLMNITKFKRRSYSVSF